MGNGVLVVTVFGGIFPSPAPRMTARTSEGKDEKQIPFGDDKQRDKGNNQRGDGNNRRGDGNGEKQIPFGDDNQRGKGNHQRGSGNNSSVWLMCRGRFCVEGETL
jgi:hypothetical protein